ncbi:MAG: family 10 glycosylhydrolase [Streptosporangiales bacterium]|nr:family 10 glycosylhydrolase [Streptosporangiales bacterium]
MRAHTSSGPGRLLRRCAVALSLALAATAACTGGDDEATDTPTPAPSVSSARTCAPRPDVPKHQMRGMWVASVRSLDWPSKPGLSVREQQAELVAQLDLARENRLNAVFLQVRPSGDTFWPSELEPWSQWLSGKQGKDPGYDPLAFAVREAHERNIELHAWFNPYRASFEAPPVDLTRGHPARQHPSWVFKYGKDLYYDPGVPAAREFVQRVVLEAVRRYDIDGVHFDDYFYPYPLPGKQLPDKRTFARYGDGFDHIGAWRRHNVNTMVRDVGRRIHAEKPAVKFGISPFGIWKNDSSDPRGSPTKGLESFHAIYADSRTWVKRGWIDYVAPQLYWHRGFAVADYAKLVPWWADLVRDTDVHLYIGQAAYRLGTEKAWRSRDVLSANLALNRNYPAVRGDVYFNAASVREDRGRGFSRLVDDHYSRPAMLPPIDHLGGRAPGAPRVLGATAADDGVTVRWRDGPGRTPTSYAVYRVAGESASPCAFADARSLVATVRRGDRQTFVDRTAEDGTTYTYYVTGVDRLGNESQPGPGRTTG